MVLIENFVEKIHFRLAFTFIRFEQGWHFANIMTYFTFHVKYRYICEM